MMEPDVNPFAIFARYAERAPVDLDAIARDLAIPVTYLNLGADVAGQINRDPNASPRSGFVIWINSSQHPNRQRFTLAHELAHYALHRDLIEAGLTDDTMYRSTISGHYETQANRLAADILMPIRLVKREADSGRSADDLARAFKVSKAAMEIRLKSVVGSLGQASLF